MTINVKCKHILQYVQWDECRHIVNIPAVFLVLHCMAFTIPNYSHDLALSLILTNVHARRVLRLVQYEFVVSAICNNMAIG